MFHQELAQILSKLEFDTEISKLWQEVQAACSDSIGLSNIIISLQKILKETDSDQYHEKRPFYWIFLSYASYIAHNGNAIDYAERAIFYFDGQGNEWNKAVSNWHLGTLCRQLHPRRAKERLEYALQILNKLEGKDIKLGLYNKEKYEGILKALNQSYSKIDASAINHRDHLENAHINEPSRSGAPAILQTIPIYDSVIAGKPRGGVFKSESFLEIENFVINNQSFCLKSSYQSGRIIQKDPNMLYVLKVVGNSMNNSTPEAVNDGDYVLVYKTNSPQPEDIVVVEFHDGIDIKSTLKRLKKRENRFFLSPESTDPSYHEIPLNAESTIRGIVIGVFKPCSSQIDPVLEPRSRSDIPKQNSQSFEEISKHSIDLLGASVIVINRPQWSDTIINEILIPEALDENAIIIFALTPSGEKHKKSIILHDNDDMPVFTPRQTYKVESGTQKDNAKVIAHIRSWLRERTEQERKNRTVFIFDTLQKWAEELEVQIRYLIQESSSLNLSVWIHSPIFLIPNDLLPTIGNVIIIWPSKSEIKLLEENLPGLDVDLEAKKQLQGLFIYNERIGNEWKVIEFTP